MINLVGNQNENERKFYVIKMKRKKIDCNQNYILLTI